ncbi:MAG: hypothetical protein J6M92_13085 [Oribacterium sp.]|nr:hypothetical protein [Oribacterium sp.]
MKERNIKTTEYSNQAMVNESISKEEDYMATFTKVEKWFDENKAMLMKIAVVDPEQILTSENGHKKGAYLVSVKLKNRLIPMYAGEAGADDEHDRCIADRLKEHLHRWFAGGYTEYWTGIKKSELISGRIRFHLHIVGESDVLEERKKMETEAILTKKPYLQYGPYKKYDSEYDGIDLCIVPFNGTRRKAFLARLKELGIKSCEKDEEKELLDKILNKGCKPDWKKIAKEKYDAEPYASNFRVLIRKGSELHKDVKAALEEAMGIVSGGKSTGIRYDRLITLLSNAMAEADGATE